jgi:hypothetical protein
VKNQRTNQKLTLQIKLLFKNIKYKTINLAVKAKSSKVTFYLVKLLIILILEKCHITAGLIKIPIILIKDNI